MKTLTKAAICCISLLMITSVVLPTVTTALPSTAYVGASSIEEYNVWDDCYLAEEDADALVSQITSDGYWQQKFRIKEANNHQDQWEYTGDQDTVETAHFAYYAGHGFSGILRTKLVFKVSNWGVIYDSPRIYPDYCDWGDEGCLKWVALAACDVGKRTYKALDGVHLICGCKCEIDEALYGDNFGGYMINDYSIKWSWFTTMDDYVAKVDGVVNVVGEDSSVGNDHLYGHGSVADDPPVDNYYYEWTHDPNEGWYSEGPGSKAS